MIRSFKLTTETVLYAVILGAAVLLRLSGLGELPLSDGEATEALQAAAATQAGSPFWNPEPSAAPSAAYRAWTRLIFQFGAASDFGARILPVAAGTGIVLTPLLIRRRFGRGTSLAMALLLALSPALVTTSRTAGGDAIAALALLLAIGLLTGGERLSANSKPLLWAALALGVAFASGSATMNAFLGLGLGTLIFLLMSREREALANSIRGFLPSASLQTALFFIGGFLAAGAGFGLAPTGLEGFSEAVSAWAGGWARPASFHAVTILSILPIYEPLTLVAGLLGAVSALRAKDKAGSWAASWALGAWALALIYPGRRPEDLIWALVPLCYLGARAVIQLAERFLDGGRWTWALLLSSVLLVLLSFSYFQLVEFAQSAERQAGESVFDPRLLQSLGALLLAVMAVFLFGLGWEWRSASHAGAWTAGLALMLIAITTGWRMNRPNHGMLRQELWRRQAVAPGLDLVRETLHSFSAGQRVNLEPVRVAFADDPTPSLAWALRDAQPTSLDSPAGQSPPILVARDDGALPGLAADYIGQNLSIGEEWGWTGDLPPNFLAWLVRRDGPSVGDRWILLVRSDLGWLTGSVPGDVLAPPKE